jgi:protein-tyrosine phosphatase
MAFFDFITHRLATGAAFTNSSDVDLLAQAGITHVIDCAIELESSDGSLLSAHKPGFVYLPNGVDDDGRPKPAGWFARSIDFALTAMSTPGTKIYAHCAAGINRGPSTAYAILLAMGIEPAMAEQMIRGVRPIVGLAYKADAENAVVTLKY